MTRKPTPKVTRAMVERCAKFLFNRRNAPFVLDWNALTVWQKLHYRCEVEDILKAALCPTPPRKGKTK